MARTAFQFSRALSSDAIWFGAPVLDAVTDGKIVVWNTDDENDNSQGNNDNNNNSNSNGGS